MWCEAVLPLEDSQSPQCPSLPMGFSSLGPKIKDQLNSGSTLPLASPQLCPAPPGQSKRDNGIIKPSPHLNYCSGNLIPNHYLWLLISALLITAVSDL